MLAKYMRIIFTVSLSFLSLTTLIYATSPSWTQLSPSGTAPATRESHTAVDDTTHNVMTIFGGYNDVNSVDTNDAWVLSHANGLGGIPAWTHLTPTGSLPT